MPRSCGFCGSGNLVCLKRETSTTSERRLIRYEQIESGVVGAFQFLKHDLA
jgi:hypothetical protein